MFLSQLEKQLAAGEIHQSMLGMRAWLKTAAPGEPEELLTAASVSLRPKLALLLRDLLSRYPSTILGIPLIFFVPSDEEEASETFRLPFPPITLEGPSLDLHFLGWLPADTPLPLESPFRPERHSVTISRNKPVCSVALFRSHPDIFDLDNLDVPYPWWGHLFSGTSGHVNISSTLLLPYPDALEAARLMQAKLSYRELPRKGFFLTDGAWTLALDAASDFQETLRGHQYSP